MSSLTAAAALAAATMLPLSANAAGIETSGTAPGDQVIRAAEPVKVEKTSVPAVPSAARTAETRSSTDVVAELEPTSTDDFRMVGVTWAIGGPVEGVHVEVRTRTAGVWSAWTDLEVEDDGEGGLPGTEPLWVGEADGVAARVTSEQGTPEDVHLSTIDPGDDGASVDSASAAAADAPVDGVARVTTAATTGDGTPTYTEKPTIISRAAWGAGAGTPCDTPLVGSSTRGVVIHHTAGSNTYTKAQSAAIVRGVQAYHVKSRKWCDIGYNFLVDKYGQIFEGRRGGMDRAVRAAHSGNVPVNTYTMGVSMMGNLDKVRPSAAMQSAMVKVIGWRMGTNFLKAKGTYSLGGLKLNMIAGHRNVISTGCPGKYGYAWLSAEGGLRDRVESYISKYSTPISKLRASLGASATGAVYIGEYGNATNRKARLAKMDLYSKTGLGAYAVAGTFRSEFNRIGSQSGVMGYPRSAETAIGSTGITRQNFVGGSVYGVPKSGSTKAYSLVGDIASTYAKLGGPTGVLGAPTSSTAAVSTGVTRANFAKGYILTTASTKKTTAHEADGTVIPIPVSGAAPAKPSGLTATTTTSGATITWKASSGATSYEACLTTGYAATTCWRTVDGLTTPRLVLTGLVPTVGTDYYVKVRALTSKASAWSTRLAFDLQVPAAGSAAYDTVTVPSSRVVAVTGHGYGHGIGMSQYGAQGAARDGVTYDKILARYYPGTALGSKTGTIRVLISQDTSVSVLIGGQAGLVFRDVAAKKTLKLPTTAAGKKIVRWRIVPTTGKTTQSTLQYRTTGSYTTYKSTRWTGDGQFEGPAAISLVMPDNSSVAFRGAIRSALPKKGSTTRDTVNVVPIEDYTRGVVSAEMPSSWHAEALKAQSVAARTYGVRSITSARHYDICNTTACQVYGGVARETAATDAAIVATKARILTYQGTPAFTQFSSSSGGFTAAGSQPYLKAVSDPYDGWSGNPNHDWKVSLKAATVEKAYPAIGKLTRLKITKRSGGGDWGGRVSTVSLVGAKKTVTITGAQARFAFGLKSHWFRF